MPIGSGGLLEPTFLVFSTPATFQIRYVTHLDIGDLAIDISNDGQISTQSSGGNLCVGVYSFDPNEELQSCCSCLVTPDGLVSLSAKAINATNLTGRIRLPW